MYKHMVAGVLTIVLTGCSVFSDGYSAAIKKEEQETEYSSVYAEIIEFGGFKNKEYQSELNLSIQKEVEDAISAFDALASEASEALPKGVKSSLYITQNVKRNTTDMVSFITEVYTYTGGAHGNTVWVPHTINVISETPHNLSLGELFRDKDYMKKLNVIIERMVTENPDKYSELWQKPEITKENEDRFYMTDNELVIFFPPYELSYYAKGFIEFPIPISELNPILNEEFKQTK